MPNFPSVYLTKDNFLAYTGLTTGDVNIVLLDKIILSSNKILFKELGGLFSLETNKSLTFQPNKSNNIFSIGLWQKTNLVVSIIQNGTEQIQNAENYILYRVENNPEVIYAVVLNTNLCPTDELKITGTFGYSAGLPDELDMFDVNLYKIIKQAILEEQNDTDSGGRGEITQARIGEISTSYGNSNTSSNSSNNKPKITTETLQGAILTECLRIKSDFKYELDIVII